MVHFAIDHICQRLKVLEKVAGFAELEHSLIRERTATVTEHKKITGEWVGKILFGLDLVDDNKSLRETSEKKPLFNRCIH